ncbi:MAG: Ig-like domain-containing protein, partial [Peptococcaceae bacterium]|nr:Ig-like domain-containing protein [Peptococcaceae bacterium]
VTLTATVLPENATNKTVTWTSSDETVATVADGVVTALKAGNVTITATADGKSATCEVTVKAKSSGYYGGGYVSSISVSIASDDNATVKVSDKYADKGETVTITVDTKDGFYAKDVVVTDKNGEAITVTRVALDKWTFTMPSGKVKVDVDTAEYSKEVVLQIGDLDIAVNDAVIQSDVAPFIKNDRTMVPISVIVYALGGTTDWDGETRTVTVTLDGKVLTMVIDEIIPGFGAAAIIVDSRTYVPIGYVADVLGCDVDWIAAARQVVIVK